MKSFASIALFGAALVAAAPLNEEKRDIVWHTTWTEVTETVLTTTTKWVAPGSEVSAAAVNPGGDFHETAVHYSPKPTPEAPFEPSFPAYNKPTEKPAAPAPAPTSSSSPAPPPPPPPAPATPSSISTYVAPTPEATYVAPTPSTSETPPPPPPPSPTSVYVAPKPTTTPVYVAPKPTSTYVAPAPVAPTPAASPASSSSGSSSGGASYSDVEMTYYSPGLGSCGITSTDSEMIVAVAASTMTKNYGGGNPNNNPMCGKKISITANGVTQTATVVDTCPGCLGPTDLDLSPSLFQKFASESVGRIHGASWKLLD